MAQEIRAALLPAENSPGVSGLESSIRREGFAIKKNKKTWLLPEEGMPPIVRFVMHAARWCKSSWIADKKEGAPLRLVGQLALGAKRNLALVEVGGVQFLVGGGAEHVTVIVPVPAAIDTRDVAKTTGEASPGSGNLCNQF